MIKLKRKSYGLQKKGKYVYKGSLHGSERNDVVWFFNQKRTQMFDKYFRESKIERSESLPTYYAVFRKFAKMILLLCSVWRYKEGDFDQILDEHLKSICIKNSPEFGNFRKLIEENHNAQAMKTENVSKMSMQILIFV